MDGAKYRKIREENLLLSARMLKLGREFIFQHDNDPKHTAKATLEWHSQSPDRNPIENLWHDLKILVHQRSPCNLTELEQFYTEEWANIAQSRRAKLGETYPNILIAVVAVKNASTNYLLKGVDTYRTKIC